MSAAPVSHSAIGRLFATRGVQAGLRVAIVVAPIASYVVTCLAAGSGATAVLLLVIVLALVCALAPDGHVGLLVTAVVAVHWLVVVEDRTSAWSLAVALALGVLHLAMAAAGVAPPAARWTPAMVRRWSGRAAVTAGATLAVFGVTRVIGADRVDGGAAVLVVALAAATVGALWLRARSLSSS